MLFSKPSPAGTTSPSSGDCGSWNSAKSSLPVGTGARCSATRCCWGPSPCKTWISCCGPGERGQVGLSGHGQPWRLQPTKQIEKELALLDWMHSEIDLIEADLPFNST